MWTRELAFELIGRLEPALAANGAHCALAGSVCYRGYSQKDLDIIVYPHTKTLGEPWDTRPIKQLLNTLLDDGDIKDCGGVSQIRDDKEVAWIKTKDGKRVDFFFLS